MVWRWPTAVKQVGLQLRARLPIQSGYGTKFRKWERKFRHYSELMNSF
jgi:hypothetical protein